MSKPIVYISHKLPREWFKSLEKDCIIKIHSKAKPPSRREFLHAVKQADAVIPILNEKIDVDFFKANPHLKIVANYAVGYDNIDLAAAAKHKVPVSNTPGDFSQSVAEHALALIFALAKNLLPGYEYMRQGRYKFWDPLLLLGNDVKGAKLGIVGTGRIGSALAKMAHTGFGMKIAYYDAAVNKEIEKSCQAVKRALDQLLKESDFVSLHVPLLPSTRHLLGAKELALMKKTAYLVNTARGAVIDEKALVKALKKGVIAGAGLDVYENEPKLAAGLARLKNVILTPHIASATFKSRLDMAEIAAENVLDVLVRGKKPRNEVKAG